MRFLSIIILTISFSSAFSQEVKIIKLRTPNMQERALLKMAAPTLDGNYLIGKADFNDDKIDDFLIVDTHSNNLSAKGEVGASLITMGKAPRFYHLSNGTDLADTMQFTLGPVQPNGIRSLIMTRDGFIMRGNRPNTPFFSKVLEYTFMPTMKTKSTAQNNSEASFLSQNDQQDRQSDDQKRLASEDMARIKNLVFKGLRIQQRLAMYALSANKIGFFDAISDQAACHDDKKLNSGKCLNQINESTGSYYGETVENYPSGRGVYIYNESGNSFEWKKSFGGIFPEADSGLMLNKSHYVGEWQSALETGVGYLSLSNQKTPKSKFQIIAHWKNSELNGPIYFSSEERNGNVDDNLCFSGTMKNGKAQGVGFSRWYEEKNDEFISHTYIGNFNNGERNGNGIHISTRTVGYRDQLNILTSIFIGSFKEGKPDGAGIDVKISERVIGAGKISNPQNLRILDSQTLVQSGLWKGKDLQATGQVAFLSTQLANVATYQGAPISWMPKIDKLPIFGTLAHTRLKFLTAEEQRIKQQLQIRGGDIYGDLFEHQNKKYLENRLYLVEDRNLPICSKLSDSKNRSCYFIGKIDAYKYWPENVESNPSNDNNAIYLGLAANEMLTGEAIVLRWDEILFVNFANAKMTNPSLTIKGCSMVPTRLYGRENLRGGSTAERTNIGWENFLLMKTNKP